MKTKLCMLMVVAAVACGGDDGSSQDTGTGETTGTTNATTNASLTMTTDESSGPVTLTTTDTTTSVGTESSTTSVDESSSSTAADSSTSGTTGPVEFALTSPEFVEGGGLPHTAHIDGGNESPQLDWVGAPPGTMSYAVFFHDITIDFEHSAIWDIPADVTGLPHDVDHDAMPADVPGAIQCHNWTGEFGYGGPGSPANFYEFILYAIDVDTIPEIDETSTLLEVWAALDAHSLGMVTLTGQSTGP